MTQFLAKTAAAYFSLTVGALLWAQTLSQTLS